MAKRNNTALSDEQIVAALMQANSIKEAAMATGTTPRTIYDRFNDAQFRQLYMFAKNDLIRRAVFSINEKLAKAVETVAGLMTDDSVNPAIRLQAAQTIFANAEKFSCRLNTGEERSRSEVEDSERKKREQAEWDKAFYGS